MVPRMALGGLAPSKALGGIGQLARSGLGAASGTVPRRTFAKKSEAAKKEEDDEVTFELSPFKTYNFGSPPTHGQATKEECWSYLREMYEMRRMEVAAGELYTQSYVRGFCHLYDGQEAVAVGMKAVLTMEDPLITAYRNHCQELTRGATPRQILSELTGRYTGVSKGKGGSMHMYNRKNNYFGGNGIVGAQVPLGAGLAFTLKYNQKKNHVAVTMFGDGAANQGQVAEAINMASLWHLPMLFVCENNRYGMGTSTKRASATQEFYKREQYIPGLKIDGMDVLAVKEGIKYAKEYAIENGPVFIEMDTYRYRGHSMSDPGIPYRTKEEISDVRKSRDAIERMKVKLMDSGYATAQEIKEMQREVQREIDDAVEFAKGAPEPPVTELFHDVYKEPEAARGTLLTNGNKVGWLANAHV